MRLSEQLAEHVLPDGMQWHFNEHHRHGTPIWNLTEEHHTFAHLSVRLNHKGDISYVGFFHPRHRPTPPVRFSTCELEEVLSDIAAAVAR
jgi:hypothetical protein